jgi:hypothetical protein
MDNQMNNSNGLTVSKQYEPPAIVEEETFDTITLGCGAEEADCIIIKS